MNKILISLLFLSLFFSDINYQVLSKKTFMDDSIDYQYQRGTFLIVLSKPDFYSRFSSNAFGHSISFIDFKKSQGYDVEVISFREGNDNIEGINGTTEDDLKDYLMNYYEQNPMLEYVLLVGDVNQQTDSYNIPTFEINSYNPPIVPDQTDYPYTFVDDDSVYDPLFFVGRWSISANLDVNDLISRTITYYTLKKNGIDIDESFEYLNNALLVAGNYNGDPDNPQTWPVTPVWTNKWLMEELYDYGYSRIDTAFFHQQNYDLGGEQNPQIENSFNDGIGIVNYRGWGDATGWHKPKFHLDDFVSLNNTKQPVVFSFVCNTADFGNESNPFCFGESLITSGTLLNPSGAVAMIGPSDLDTDTRFNNVMCGAIWDDLLEERVSELAPALHCGKRAVYNEFKDLVVGLNPTNIPYFYHHVYVVLGDPSLPVWLKKPGTMLSDFDSDLNLDNSYISTTITDESGNSLSDVVGVVIHDGAIIGKGISNHAGYMSVEFSDIGTPSTLKFYLNKAQYRQKEYSLEYTSNNNDPMPDLEFPTPIVGDEPQYVFLDSNSSHELAPDYNWIEISELGQNLNLIDDSSVTINIGFDFRYYDRSYSSITVGSNGWASFLPCLNGDGVEPDCEVLNYFFNNSIGFPIGPYGLLAPFYDDLDDNGGTEPFNVYAYLDEANHQFIIQWDNIANGQTDEDCVVGDDTSCQKETFQVILYDPAYHQYGSTDNGIILFQYQEIYDIDDHGCTIGIESPDKNQGLQYLFNYSYNDNASTLANNLAIKFFVIDNPTLDNELSVNIPEYFKINSAYPNPFNPSINIDFSVQNTSSIMISVFDINGRKVQDLYEGVVLSGDHSIVWEPNSKISSGVYFIRLESLNQGIGTMKQITFLK
ncbi:MAG: hypothetical protein CMG00_03265 [Candidatus Marinimicrobia bacterium]|nr:hypothetical protein [Candidatus Neomarinimicrobiota bacterium]